MALGPMCVATALHLLVLVQVVDVIGVMLVLVLVPVLKLVL